MLKKLVIVAGIISTVLACGSNTGPKIDAARLYKTNCMICHGLDGKLGINGAKDIPNSPMTLNERIGNITNGAGQMTPFKNILSKEEIEAVAKYTLTLKK